MVVPVLLYTCFVLLFGLSNGDKKLHKHRHSLRGSRKFYVAEDKNGDRHYADGSCQNCDSNARCVRGLCICMPHYVGDGHVCEQRDLCKPNPCENNGVCHPFEEGGPRCACVNGYAGRYCQSNNPCLPNPCNHGGSCHQFGEDPKCVCTNDFSGRYCDMEKNIINSIEGNHHAEGYHEHELHLPEALHIPEAEHQLVHLHQLACDSNPCWNGATCIDEYHGGFKCICRTGWRGPLCQEQEEADPCNPNPCKVGEVCIDYGQSYRCKSVQVKPAPTPHPTKIILHIKTGPTKPTKTPAIPSPPLPLKDAATATPPIPSPPVPKTTKRPSKKVTTRKTPKPHADSPCHPNPCQNSGTCHEFDNGHNYACICAVGYDGTHCQEDICAGCHVYAMCPHGRCKCKHGYLGDGYDCYKESCDNCHPQANCQYGECVCNKGWRGNGVECTNS